jgi:alpha-mannosidase
MVELDGKSQFDVHVSFAGPVAAAREVNGQELPVGSAQVSGGDLVTSFTAYQPRTFALKLGTPAAHLAAPQSQPVALNYDLAVASNDDTKTVGGGMDGKGDAIPAEMLPKEIDFNGVHFQLPAAATGVDDALVSRGQTITLPAKPFNRIFVLAASDDQDQEAQFKAGSQNVDLKIQAWNGFIGQWDTRIWAAGTGDNRDWASSAHHQPWPPADLSASESHPPSPRYPEDYVGLHAGFVKPATLVWFASHHHTADGLNEPYQYSYLFAYSIDVPAGTHTLTLPNNDKIRILAVSVAEDNPSLKPAVPLYDKLGQTEPTQQMEQATF